MQQTRAETVRANHGTCLALLTFVLDPTGPKQASAWCPKQPFCDHKHCQIEIKDIVTLFVTHQLAHH